MDVKKLNEKIEITIHDNGKGFDIKTADLGNGIHNMRKRMDEINGNFTIQSHLSKGTSITISI